MEALDIVLFTFKLCMHLLKVCHFGFKKAANSIVSMKTHVLWFPFIVDILKKQFFCFFINPLVLSHYTKSNFECYNKVFWSDAMLSSELPIRKQIELGRQDLIFYYLMNVPCVKTFKVQHFELKMALNLMFLNRYFTFKDLIVLYLHF